VEECKPIREGSLSRQQCLGIRPQLTWLHSSSSTRWSEDETGPAKPPKMALNLSAAQHEQLAGMIEFSALSDVQIAEQAGQNPIVLLPHRVSPAMRA
jgi:hypothetical protein